MVTRYWSHWHTWRDGRTYLCMDVHDIMAIKPNFLTSMGYHIFLAMVLREGAHGVPLLHCCVLQFATPKENGKRREITFMGDDCVEKLMRTMRVVLKGTFYYAVT